MDPSIGDLVLAPFRDIVAQGRTASGNADEAHNDGMRTAARNLVREGERALKRLEPLCRKKYEDFGAAFVNSLKDDGKDKPLPLNPATCNFLQSVYLSRVD